MEYQVTLQSLFEELDEESGVFDTSMRRIDISAKYRGITIKFKELIARMKEDAEVQRRLLSDKTESYLKIFLPIRSVRKFAEKFRPVSDGLRK